MSVKLTDADVPVVLVQHPLILYNLGFSLS
jgi:hypothetical protein